MFKRGDERRKRRITQSRAHARAEPTRRTILELLRAEPMGGAELQAQLGGHPSSPFVDYHLTVLVEAGEVVVEDGLYRLR